MDKNPGFRNGAALKSKAFLDEIRKHFIKKKFGRSWSNFRGVFQGKDNFWLILKTVYLFMVSYFSTINFYAIINNLLDFFPQEKPTTMELFLGVNNDFFLSFLFFLLSFTQHQNLSHLYFSFITRVTDASKIFQRVEK